MKKFAVLVLLFCMIFTVACANDADTPEMPETHAAAIDPDKVKTVRVIRYDEAGEEELSVLLEEGNLAIPLLATVYDTALTATPAADRRCDISATMRMTDGSEVTFKLYTDDTMEANGAVLEGTKMRQFIYSFVAGFAPQTTAAETTAPAEGAGA